MSEHLFECDSVPTRVCICSELQDYGARQYRRGRDDERAMLAGLRLDELVVVLWGTR